MCCHLENFVEFNLPADGGHHGPLVGTLLHLLSPDEPHRLAGHHQVPLLHLASACYNCYINPQPSTHLLSTNLESVAEFVDSFSKFNLLPFANKQSKLRPR